MSYVTDIAVYSPDGHLQLVVEVKRIAGKSSEWAAQMRRNLIAHRLLPRCPFFLLASMDHFYLWKDSTIPDIIPADYQADASEILERYLKASDIRRRTASGYSLEMAIASWLNEVVSSRPPTKPEREQFPLLYESGLYDSIWGGSVVTEAEI